MSDRTLDKIRAYFKFERHNASFVTEVVAGTATYLSLSYIFVLNPAILSQAGISPHAVLFATVVASAAATILMGLWANLPFAVAPGLEISTYFTFIIFGALHLNWMEGLTVVFMSGILNVSFTMMQLRDNMVTAIPLGLKRALGACVGAFIISIALQLTGIVSYKDGIIDAASLNQDAITSHAAMLLYIGTAIAFMLGPNMFNFPLNIFVSLAACIVISYYFKIEPALVSESTHDMLSAVGKIDFSLFMTVLNAHVLSSVIVLFAIDFIGGAGKIVGLTAMTNIQDTDGGVPNLRRALYVDGIGTIFGSLLGTSSLVAFVESGVGIRAGGRTGLTAVVCALLMAGSFLFEPLLRFVPPQAIAGVLVYVGYLLMPWKIDPTGRLPHTLFDIIVGCIMAGLALLTFGIDKAMAVGFSLYFARCMVQSDFSQKALWLGIIAVTLYVTVAIQYIVV